MKIGIIIFISLFVKDTLSAKILGVFPITAPSHYFLGSALMRGLAEKGHDVTVISAFGEKNPPKNGSYRDIILTGFVEERNRMAKEMNIWAMGEASIFLMIPFMINMMLNTTSATLSHPNVQKLLHSKETFDVVIVEQFMNEAHKGFAPHFNAPLVLLSTIGANTWVNILNANPAPTSYVADVLLSYSSDMTIFERTMNTLAHVYAHLLYNYFAFPKHKQLYDAYFPNAPNFYDTLYNGSIYLLNSHPSTNQPVPYVPNMIDIGGFHVKPTNKLPEDLQKFLNESKEGVIYFSMGSNLKSSLLPPEKRDAFLKTFQKLKYQILWKWEEDVLPGQPKNVRLGKWLPQQEILAHPNVKLFITHGGFLSTTETVYHGVPVLAIPVLADQKLNAKKIVNEGIGLSLDFKNLSEETLTEKLSELFQNPRYAENAERRSKIFHDRQVKPLDIAIYWVEYVIRHGGAPHLRVAGVDLPWCEYMLLDVIAFITVVVLVGLHIFFKIAKITLSKCLGSRKKKLKKN